MISSIVFDIGGVFFLQPEELTNRIWRQHGLENGMIGNELMYGSLWEVYKRGGMSEEEYWQQISSKLPSSSWRNLKDDFENAVVLDKDLVELVRKLKRSHYIHALSNAGAELERRLHRFEIMDLFNVIVNSHYVNLAKPDEKIFSLTAKLVQAKPSEILFVDDKVRNTSVAEKMGFNVHVYTTVKNFIADMERLKLPVKMP